MTHNRHQLRAVLLTVVMVLSVLATGMAFTGGVAATQPTTSNNGDMITPVEVVTLGDGRVTHDVDFNVTVNNAEEAGNFSFAENVTSTENETTTIVNVNVEIFQSDTSLGNLTDNVGGVEVTAGVDTEEVKFDGTVTVDYTGAADNVGNLILKNTNTTSFNSSSAGDGLRVGAVFTRLSVISASLSVSPWKITSPSVTTPVF